MKLKSSHSQNEDAASQLFSQYLVQWKGLDVLYTTWKPKSSLSAWSDLLDIYNARFAAVKFFSKLNKIFVGYFDPKNIFLHNKNK